MPSARELLEQADALMRRNRGEPAERTVRAAPVAARGPAAASTPAAAPTPAAAQATGRDDPLRDYLPEGSESGDASGAGEDAPLAPTVILFDDDLAAASPSRIVRDALAVPSRIDERASGTSDPPDERWLETLVDLPLLTDVVEAGTTEEPEEKPIPEAEATPSPEAEASPPPDRERAADWPALAEEIRAQVLQRLDLFTDTGLREQLGVHLQPIVDRASVELVDTINREVGQLVRSYVAEAIEREIEAWRNRSA